MSDGWDPKAFNAGIIEEFRANGGTAPSHFGATPLVILHTVGARSGKEHLVPLVTQLADDRKYVFASAAGAPEHPAWYFNLKANPEIDIEFGTGTESVTAVELTGDERDAVFAAQVEAIPQFGEYEVSAGERTIPVFALEPR